MQFELPQRLSATGIIGLAALSATHWLRENVSDPGPVLSFVLGVMPNLAAAFAMPLILASFKPRTSHAPMTKVSRFTYFWVLSFTTLGLCGWELIQTRSDRFVFDIYDLLATGFGSILAYFAFAWHARTFEVQESRTTLRGDASRWEVCRGVFWHDGNVLLRPRRNIDLKKGPGPPPNGPGLGDVQFANDY